MIWLIAKRELLFILLLGLGLRLINLNQSFWLDEATQVILSKDSISNILFTHGADFHPPLSYILMHFWIIFSSSEIWVRLLSVIFGILTIWVLYKFSSKILNPTVGLLAAFLLAISPYHIYYSQEARMYSEMTFFACVSMYYFYLFIKNNSPINSIIYIFSSVALIYTHYDGGFLLIAQFLYVLFLKRVLLASFLKRIFLVFLFWLPWLPQFLAQLSGGLSIDQYLPGWKNILSVTPYKAIPLTFFKFSFGRIDFDNQLLYIFVAAVVLLIFGYIFFKGVKNIKDVDSKLILFWFFIPVIVAMLISFKIPINQPFRILYVIPAYCILLALGIFHLKNLKKIFLFTLITLSLSGLSLYYLNPKYWREDWKKAVEFTDEKISNNTAVIFAWSKPFSPYEWYSKNNVGKGVITNFPASDYEINKQFSYLEDKNEVLFFQYLQVLSDPNNYIQKNLGGLGFNLKDTYNFNGVGFIYHYTRSEP